MARVLFLTQVLPHPLNAGAKIRARVEGAGCWMPLMAFSQIGGVCLRLATGYTGGRYARPGGTVAGSS